jgi:hypothetical protein
MKKYSNKDGKNMKLSRVDKQDMKYNVTAQLIKTIKKLYDESSIYEKSFLETIVGAAVFYLPSGSELWSGKMSRDALKSFLPETKFSGKIVKEHEYPRKVAAKYLLEEDWDKGNIVAKLRKLYLNKYGRYNYVTSEENGKLRKYQKVDCFQNPCECYREAGIQLINNLNQNKLKQIKSQNKEVISDLLASNK